jgi:YebC/PmpR family DNA-binding regulatory protein
MAGHSHSANIARRKGAVDAKRGKAFSKLSRAIISAARGGGPDPDQNLKLKYAIDKAKAANMPKDTIERAIARGSGSKEDGSWQELIYEGYAPGGVALLVACLTDNRNRTAPDIKHLFERGNGSLGAPGSVSYLFELRSTFALDRAGRDEDALTELAREVGADDVEVEGDTAVLYGPAADFDAMRRALEEHGLEPLASELAYIPGTRVQIASKDEAARVLRLIGSLEDNDDVQNVFANYDMPSEWIDELGAA